MPEYKELAGQKILITRALSQAEDFSGRLKALGGNPVLLPVIEFKKPRSYNSLDLALNQLSDYDWLIFASVNAVSSFLERYRALNIDLEKLKNLKVGAIGSATSSYLKEQGIAVTYQPDRFVAENFLEQFPGIESLAGVCFLWPRTNVGRTLIHDQLTEYGAKVVMVEAYRTELPEPLEDHARKLFELCNKKEIEMITLASSQTVKNFATILKAGLVHYASDQGIIINPQSKALDASIKYIVNEITIASIGPVTSSTARKILGKVDIEANVHTVDGLIESITSFYSA